MMRGASTIFAENILPVLAWNPGFKVMLLVAFRLRVCPAFVMAVDIMSGGNGEGVLSVAEKLAPASQLFLL